MQRLSTRFNPQKTNRSGARLGVAKLQMKYPITFACASAILSLAPISASGDQVQSLEGTWAIDPVATAAHIKRLGPPAQNAEWLPSILLRLCVTTLTFENGSMTVDPISPAPMTQVFRLEQQSERKLAFMLIGAVDGKKDTLTIAFLNSNNITVKSANIGLDEYAVWKRGKRPNRNTTERDFKQAFDSCTSAFQNVSFIAAPGR